MKLLNLTRRRAVERPLAYVPESERRVLLARREDPRPALLGLR